MMRKYLLLAFVFAGICRTAAAQDETPTQVTNQNRAGDLPFSQTVGVGPEHVDIGSGNLVVNLPIISLPGRHMPFNFGLRYNSLFWIAAVRSGAGGNYNQWVIENRSYIGLGFTSTAPTLSWALQSQSCPNVYGTDTDTETTANSYIYTDPTGAKHPFGIYQISAYSPDGACFAGQDGTGNFQSYDINAEPILATVPDVYSTPAIYMPDGTQVATPGDNSILSPPLYEVPPTILLGSTDANGNSEIEYPGFTDTLGKVPLTQTNSTNQVVYNVYDSSGTQRTYTVNLSTITVHTAFGVSGVAEMGPGSRTVVTSVVLPNQTSYSFQYENSTYGGLTSITLPTGATITYTWATLSPSGNPWMTFRYVSSKTVTVGGNSATWTFSKSCVDSPCWTINTDVGDPAGNHTLYQHLNGRVIFAKVYAGAVGATLLREYDVVYGNSGGLCCVATRVTTTLDNALQSKIEYDYDSTGNIPGNVSEMREFAYAPGAPGPVIRRTDKTYGLNSNSSYVSRNIVSKVTQETVYDSTTNTCQGLAQPCAQTQYEYDNYVAGDNPLLATTNVAQHDYTNFSSALIYRGNATRAKRWRNTDGALLATTYQYDDLGNIRAIKDPLGHITAYSYNDNWANSACPPPAGKTGQAYVYQMTNALNQSVTKAYNSCAGTLASATDPNNLAVTHSYEMMHRRIQSNFPDAGQATACFSEVSGSTCYSSSLPLSITQTQKINGSLTRTSKTILDGLGRTSETQLTSDPQGTVLVDTTYDALGRVASVSNPYRQGTDPTSSPGITTYAYEPLSRKKSETYPDGSVLTTAYCGPTTLVTDPTGRWRRSTNDALGQLIEVDEPNAPGTSVNSNGCPGQSDPIWVTVYSYDALGNLTSVVQNGSHQRTFTYNSLSQLLTSTNPEVGTITYTYNSDGTVASKKDGRNITATYSYDPLHRLTTSSYSNGDPTITTTYDGSGCLGLTSCQNIGHATSISDGAGSESWAYRVDSANLRSIHVNQRTTSGVTKTSTYYLDLAGNLTSITYPTGRVVNYAYDAANRPATAADSANGITYAGPQSSPPTGCLTNAVCYTPQGSFYALSIGQSSSFAGLNLSHTYNNRLQPNEFKASSIAGNAIDITYSFADPLNSNKNAGHVFAVTNNLDSTRSQTFSYDQLNRITAAQTTSTYATSPAHCWGETYNLDPWGNLQSLAGGSSQYTGCTYETGFTKTPDGNNHLSGLGYDASGNTTSDGFNSYTWDAESQLKVTAGSTYVYDGDGRRVAKANTAMPPVPYKLYWYGSGGEILAETDALGNTTAEYVFFDGKRIAMLPAGGNAQYYVEDLLGTSRVMTTNTGTLCYDGDFYPYGGERTYTNSCPTGNNYKFEGKERDTETGNDDFGARYYTSRFGRWLSADWSSTPVAVPYANLTNPQTLNLYAMVSDDPESFADLDGHDDEPRLWDQLMSYFGLSVRAYSSAGSEEQLKSGQTLGGSDMTLNDALRLQHKANEEAAKQTQNVMETLDPTGFAAVMAGRAAGTRTNSDVAMAFATLGLGEGVGRAIGRAMNIMTNELSTRTLQAAAREAAGEVVATNASGQAYDHILKVQNGLRGLTNTAKTLTQSLKNSNLSSEARAALQSNLKAVNKRINKTKAFFKKHNIPLT